MAFYQLDPEVTPQEVGMDKEALNRLASLFRSEVEAGKLFGGAQLAVALVDFTARRDFARPSTVRHLPSAQGTCSPESRRVWGNRRRMVVRRAGVRRRLPRLTQATRRGSRVEKMRATVSRYPSSQPGYSISGSR